MSDLARLAGQLLSVGFDGPTAPDWLLRRISAGEVGGVMLFRPHIVDPPQLAALVGTLRAAAPVDAPLLVSVDQEGGLVQRVRAPATVWPPMLSVGTAGDPARTAAVGRALGEELAALGIGWDFAPVLDVHTNPANPVIGDRAFGSEAETVARRALAFAQGLAQAGILACGKHYPGHGDTDQDSHLALPLLSHDLERLRAVELLPFARAAEAGLPMIMTAHVVFEALDPGVPATLSRRVLGDLLRGELGYRGLVVSDDLDMKAVVDHVGVADAAVRAVAAGCDALLLCRDRGHQDEAFEGLVRSCERDSQFRARIALAAAAIRLLKQRLVSRPPAPPLSILGQAAPLAAELAG